MGQFVEIQANKSSIAKRKPVFGVGINDASYKIVKKGLLRHAELRLNA